jgi:hypothetical protein
MPRTDQSQNGSTNSEGGIDGLIEQAETVKTSLRETLNQVGTFISDLKRQKKQAKLVRSTLASLKQLQSLDA